MRISDDQLERIRERVDLLELVQQGVVLKQKGSSFWGLCPLHQEKTPSFHVYPARNMFKCFGCGTGGDAFTYVMKTQGLDFMESVHYLAKIAGVPIDFSEDDNKLKPVYAALDYASKIYQDFLSSEQGAEARAYLSSRKLNSSTIEQFRLGFAPDSWDIILKKLERRFTSEEVARTGLISISEQSSRKYDRFRNRIMFPIFDNFGRVISFGARTLDGSEPKYLNGPETELFKKSEVLYGFHASRQPAREQGTLVLFEGYTDFLHAQQAGIDNTAALIGVALTQSHVGLIKKRLPGVNLVLCLDSDAAGVSNVLKSIESTLVDAPSFVCLLPEGTDPADIVERGEDLSKYLEKTIPASRFYLQKKSEGKNLSTLEGRLEFLAELSPLVAGTRARALVIQSISEVSGIPVQPINDFYDPSKNEETSAIGTRITELKILSYIAHHPQVINGAEDSSGFFREFLSASMFGCPETRAIYRYATSTRDIFSSARQLASTLFRKSGVDTAVQEILQEVNAEGGILDEEKLRNYLTNLSIAREQSLEEAQRQLLWLKQLKLAEEVRRLRFEKIAFVDAYKEIESLEKKLRGEK